jgi:replicative DNA helicase
MVASPTREPIPPSEDAHTPVLVTLGDLLGEAERDLAAAHTARVEGRPRGPITGLPLLDRELGGYLAPGLHVVHGEPGIGKTAYGLQMATDCGCPSLYITCEMGRLELLYRITARLTGTFLGRLKSGEYAPAAGLALIRQAIERAPTVSIADATQEYADPTWIRAAARGVQGDAEHLLIVLDSVHSWADSVPGDIVEYDRLNSALATLRALAGALRCPVLAIAERNRDSMKRGGLSAAAGTRKFEYGGESVLDLTKDDKAPPGQSGTTAVVATLEKNRNGSRGKRIALEFDGALQRFRAV